jgi:hypothetical protein
MSLGSLIYVILRAGIPGIVGWTKIQPSTTNDESHSAEDQPSSNEQNAIKAN